MAKKQNQAVKNPAQRPAARSTAPQTSRDRPERKKIAIHVRMAIFLALVAFLINSNTLHHGYVLDDVMVVRDNTMVPHGFSAIGELFTTPHLRGYLTLSNDTYRPLSLVAFAIEAQLFGSNPSANHFFNILFFVGCVVTLFLFLHKLFREQRPILAFIAALVFALHPIHTEVTANIKSRDELMCFFFAFLSLNLFARYAKDNKPTMLAGAILSLFLSFLSKETVITFLAIIPFVFFFHLNYDKKRSIAITVSTLLVTGIFLGLRSYILGKFHANIDTPINFMDNALMRAPNAMSKLATEILILGMYLKLMFVPYPLICDHSFNSIPYTTFADPLVLLSLLLYIGMAVFAVYRFMKNRKDLWTFSILLYLASISLFTNIIIPLASTFAERFLFFCSAGACIAIAVAIDKWLINPAAEQKFKTLFSGKALVILAPLCIIYATLTYGRNEDWKDNYTLYKADVAKLPQNTRLNYYIGSELQKMYDQEPTPAGKEQINNESLDYLKKALAIYVDNTDAQAEIGAAYFRKNQIDSAEWHLKRALTLNPKQSNAAANLGTLYLNQKRWGDALAYYQKTTRLNFRNAVAQFNGGVCFYQLAQYDSAIKYFKNCIVVAPEFDNYKSFQFTALTYQTIKNMDSARKYEQLAKQYDATFHL